MNSFVYWMPAVEGQVVMLALLVGGVLLTLLSLAPAVRQRDALHTHLLSFGVGLLTILVFQLGYLVNPFKVFTSFLTFDDTTFLRLFYILGALLIAIQLWIFFTMTDRKWIGALAFVGGGAILVWIGLAAINWVGPELLEPDAQQCDAAKVNVAEAQTALEKAVADLIGNDVAKKQAVEAYIAQERLAGRVTDKNVPTFEAALAVLVQRRLEGSARFETYQQLAAKWPEVGRGVPLSRVLRLNDWQDLTQTEWAGIIGFGLVFVLGLLVFFRTGQVTWFSSFAFLTGGAAYFVALWFGVFKLNLRAIEGLLGIPHETFMLSPEGNVLWPGAPEPWVIFTIAIAAVVLVFLTYARERKSAGVGTKLILGTLRLTAIALIVLALFEPRLNILRYTAQHSHVLVLIDTSRSMSRSDLYVNRWTEDERDDNTGELKPVAKMYIRSQESRDGFGQFLVAYLERESLKSSPGNASAFRGASSTDPDLGKVVRDLADFESEISTPAKYAQDLERYQANLYERMVEDFLRTSEGYETAAIVQDLVNTLPSEMRVDRWFNLAKTDLPVAPAWTYFYLRLLTEMRRGQLSTVKLDDVNFDIGRRSKYAPEEQAPSAEVGTDDTTRPIIEVPVFGAMDNFIVELQVRRCLRLYERARQLAPNGQLDFPRYRVLWDALHKVNGIIQRRETGRGRNRNDAADAQALQAAKDLRKQIETELHTLAPRDVEDRRLFHAVMNHLLECAKAVRRIDVCLELIHPQAQLGRLLENPRFAFFERLRGKLTSGTRTRFNTIHLRTFDQRLGHLLPTEDEEQLARSLDLIDPTGEKTAIGNSMDEALRDLLKRHIRAGHIGGIVVLSDGLNNLGPLKIPATADLQVDTVGFGSRDKLCTLELFSLQGPDKVAKGNKLNILARIRADEKYKGTHFSADRRGAKDVKLLFSRIEPNPNRPGEELETFLKYDALYDNTPYQRVDKDGNPLHIPPTVDARNETVRLTPVPSTQDILIEIDPKKEGDRLREGQSAHFSDYEKPVRYRVRINREKYVDEDTYRDNYRDIWVTFTNKKTSVLLIDNRPRYEWRYLQTLLVRDSTIRFQTFMTTADLGWPQPRSIGQDPEVPPLARLPKVDTVEDKKAFFDTYDVVIIGDVSHAELGDKFCQTLEEFAAQHKGGVIFLAGEHYNPLSYIGTPLEDLVPVKLYTPAEGRDLKQPLRELEKGFVLTREGQNHPMLRLDPNIERNNFLWFGGRNGVPGGFHGFFWHCPIAEAKDGALVLITHPKKVPYGTEGKYHEFETPNGEPYPLLVWMEYGKGATLFMGTDDWWYMRGLNQDKFYRPFWNQVISYMASRRRESKDEYAEVYTKNRNNPVYTHPDRIEIEAVVRGNNVRRQLTELGVIELGEAGNNTLTVLVRNLSSVDDENVEILKLAEHGEGIFRNDFFPPSPGNYEVWIKDQPNTSHLFKVNPPEDELAPLPMDINQLAEISHPRKGEKAKRMHCMLPPQIENVGISALVLDDDSLSIQEDLGDAPLLLILVAFLLGTEWIVRKRAKLL